MKFKGFILLFFFLINSVLAQNISFEEYDLNNGLHVILHQDSSVPLVVTSVMYHVGSKNEDPNRRGFAHFFEHLLFEGTKNISRGEFMKIVESNGGSLNANTSQDRTYYYEYFPSNKLELGLWLESERMLHPVINQVGVDTQNEVVKEEKRRNYDNRPYGQVLMAIVENVFEKHPYRWTTIGEMEHLDEATLTEFTQFKEKYYVPNNAVLVVAGNFERENTKRLIQDYFGPIPKGEQLPAVSIKESPITETKKVSYFDQNIQIPMGLMAVRTPSMTSKDAYVLELISIILSDGKSSRLYKKMVDEQKIALQVQAVNLSLEDYGTYVILALPLGETKLTDLYSEIENEIELLQTELISDYEFEKLQNIVENSYVNSNSTMAGIANSLARYYTLYDDTNLINTEIEIYKSIQKDDIMRVAKSYLNKNQRIYIDYLPKETE
tara:strand:- start:1404 stop:2717 length:1314 start_codon:yes stop_codon:yes gene_type:complete